MKNRLLLSLVVISLATTSHAAPKRRAVVPTIDQELMQTQVAEAINRYDLDKAEDLLDEWENGVARMTKTELSPAHARLAARRLLIENMLERVEALTIVRADTLAASLLEGAQLPVTLSGGGVLYGPEYFSRSSGMLHDKMSTGYMPESGREIFWSGPTKNGERTLYQAGYLIDGDIDGVHPVFNDEIISKFDDMTTPFLADDGLTLYFGGKNTENSIGGYDIYRAVRSGVGEEFSMPVNMGMPYSSPGDDMLYALDPELGVGYMFSNRGVDSAHVVRYTFIPSTTRVNRSSDDTEATAGFAAISSVEKTWPEGFDVKRYTSLMTGVSANGEDLQTGSENIAIYVPARKKNFTMADMTSDRSRALMEDYIVATNEMMEDKETLSSLRREYAAGNTKVAEEIIRRENAMRAMRQRLRNISNEIVASESGR